MAPPILELNGVPLVLTPFNKDGTLIRRVDNPDTVNRFSQGQQTLADIEGFLPLRWPNLSLGLGRFRIDSDSAHIPDEMRRFFDSTLDNRWPDTCAYLPILEEDSTHSGLEEIRAAASFKGNMWSLWMDNNSRTILARKYVGSTTSFDAGGVVYQGMTQIGVESTGAATTASSITVAMPTVGAKRAIVVVVMAAHGSGSDASNIPTGVTYDGNAMTKAGDIGSPGTYAGAVSIWTLAGADVTVGTNNVVATFGSSRDEIFLAGVGVQGADLAAPFSTPAEATGVSTTPSVGITTVVGDFVVDGVLVDDGTAGAVTATVGSGQSSHMNLAATKIVRALSSRFVNASGTTTTMSWSLSGSRPWATESVSIHGYTSIPLDLLGVRTHLIALIATDDGIHVIRSTDGVTWTVSTTDELGSSILANTVTAHEVIDAGLLAEIGGEAVAAVWDEDNLNIIFYTSTDAGDNWAKEGTIAISSGNGPQGLQVFHGIDNEDKLVLMTEEALWEIDTAPSTWTSRIIRSMIGHTDNGRRMKVHSDGALWFAQGVDDDTPPSVYRMFTENGKREFEPVSNDFSAGDGMPADRMGPIRWMWSIPGQLWACAGGGKAGRNASLWCHTGKGWFSMRKHGTANQVIHILFGTADDDGTPRMHYAVRTSVGTSDANFLGQAFVNPRSGVSIKREASGYTDLPYVDGGFPLDTKTWMRFGINAEDLSGSNSGEYINVDQGITSDLGSLTARNGTDVGDFLSGTNRIALGTNGVGIAGLVIGARVNLHRASTNTNTPIWKDLQIDATVNLPKTDRYEFLVDLQESADLKGRRTTEVLTDLNTARTSDVKVPIVYADLATGYVKVLDVSYSERFESEGTQGSDANVQRRGTARVVVSEIL